MYTRKELTTSVHTPISFKKCPKILNIFKSYRQNLHYLNYFIIIMNYLDKNTQTALHGICSSTHFDLSCQYSQPSRYRIPIAQNHIQSSNETSKLDSQNSDINIYSVKVINTNNEPIGTL